MPTTGTFITHDTQAHHVLTARALTAEGIMVKYGMSHEELARTRKELGRMKLLDILFSYADGPRYDTLLHMVATAR